VLGIGSTKEVKIMSVQFGRWDFGSRPVEPDYLARAESLLAPYGSDGRGLHAESGLSMLYRAFATTRESLHETQPHISSSGTAFTWDGRLDNRGELLQELKSGLTADATDVEIVAVAYEQWGRHSFSKLLGDWALVIWNSRDQSLTLAKDFLGTRSLYYALDSDGVVWSTVLEPLVLLGGRTFSVEEEYIAGWLSLFPATHLSPYSGISSVPPSCSVEVTRKTRKVLSYWDFDPRRKVQCRSDGEYEEAFRVLFERSVARRLRSHVPVLAELSGGMDSSSIVCMADTILARGKGEAPRLDTVSYYKASEQHWNEQAYFSKVEEKRGRTGCHIDIATTGVSDSVIDGESLQMMPGSGRFANAAAKHFADFIETQGARVLLSGLGGDEVTGGVPSPVPEIADLFRAFEFRQLARQLKSWALNNRQPWLHLFEDAVREFLPGTPKRLQPVPWLDPSFVLRQHSALIGYSSRLKVFGPAPSFQISLSALDVLRRQLHCEGPPAQPVYEKRYPLLDRDLMEFLFAIPRHQLLRPGQRRSLLRRALTQIVPDEVLNRRRKAYVCREPFSLISSEWATFSEISRNMISSAIGIIEPSKFLDALLRVRRGQPVPMAQLMHTFAIEVWLRSLQKHGLLASDRGKDAAFQGIWPEVAIAARQTQIERR
jgi:asparagine synthase (glutamine-hydrolysing)